MMYDRTYWVDHVVDQSGAVIQQGTLMDQAHFNKMEMGMSDTSLAQNILFFKVLQDGYQHEESFEELVDETAAEVKTLTLAMDSQKWPFNNKDNTVALSVNRNTTNYAVEVYVESYSGGLLGNIRVKDKALNGFKLLHDGSATSVTVRIRVTGGMTA